MITVSLAEISRPPVFLWLPWPSTPRIILKGTLGFLRQILRSRVARREGAERLPTRHLRSAR